MLALTTGSLDRDRPYPEEDEMSTHTLKRASQGGPLYREISFLRFLRRRS